MFRQTITSENPALNAALLNVSTVLLGSPNATDQKRIFVTPQATDFPEGATGIVIHNVQVVCEDTIAASDTDYWTLQLKNLTTTEDLLAAAKTTKATGGTAITKDVPWDMTPDQNNTLGADEVIELDLTKASSGADLNELSATITWYWKIAL